MKHVVIRALCAVFALMAGAGAAGLATAQQGGRGIVVATAPVAGLFYPAGGAICARLAVREAEHGIRCSVTPSAGSEANLRALMAGQVDLAIVQSDWLYFAKNAQTIFAGTDGGESLRSLFTLQPQAVALVVKDSNAVDDPTDLKGKTVNIGPAGTAQRALSEVLLGTLNLSPGDFGRLTSLPVGAQIQAFCAGSIDAFVQPASHPVSSVARAIEDCDAKVLPIDGRRIRGLVRDNPFYHQAEIAAGSYKDIEEAVPTLGLHTVVVASRALPDAVAQEIVRAIASDLDGFKQQHPGLAYLTYDAMFDQLSFIDRHSAVTDALTQFGVEDSGEN